MTDEKPTTNATLRAFDTTPSLHKLAAIAAMPKVTDMMRPYFEMIERQQQMMREITRSIGTITTFQQSAMAQLAAIAGITTGPTFRQIMGPVLQSIEDIKRIEQIQASVVGSFLTQQRAATAHIAALTAPAFTIASVLDSIRPINFAALASLSRFSVRDLMTEIATNPPTLATTDGDSSDVEAAYASLDAALAGQPEVTLANLGERLNIIVGWIKQQENIQWKSHGMGFLINILAGIAMMLPTMLYDYFKRDNPPKVIIHHIREQVEPVARSAAPIIIIKIVVRPAVVKNGRKKHSSEIGTIDLGTPVTVVSKQKRWSFVRWSDVETGEVHQGWVRSKLLKGFR